MKGDASVPLSTYRFQFHKDFPLSKVIGGDLVDYLNKLGITDLYSSPLQQASPGSGHGYDVTNHTVVNPEVGTFEQLTELSRRLASHNMGFLLDIVPNHMGIGDILGNTIWTDVLENGWSSKYSHFFDIDWANGSSKHDRRVMVPILGDHIGSILDKGELKLEYVESGDDVAAFVVKYWSNTLPVEPSCYADIIQQLSAQGANLPSLEAVRSLASSLTPHGGSGGQAPSKEERTNRSNTVLKMKKDLRQAVGDADRAKVQGALEKINNAGKDQPSKGRFIDQLVNRQAYRLCFWRVAGEELNYRRFFDITSLAGLRMEDKEVFEHAHELIFKMMSNGALPRMGLRLDHPDGLMFPKEYFDRLQDAAQTHTPQSRACYVLVEKILQMGEPIRADWQVHGTVGYDFMNFLNGIFVSRDSEKTLRHLMADFAGVDQKWVAMENECKKLIMTSSMKPELTSLTKRLEVLSSMDPHGVDFTFEGLRRGLVEVIAAFPVYRTYVGEDGKLTKDDQEVVARAMKNARALRDPDTDSNVLDFIERALLAQSSEKSAYETARLQFVFKFQQTTGPVTAKGLEDTAFYRFPLLTSLCEVGGDPDHFGVELDKFHKLMQARVKEGGAGQDERATMNSTSTHDTKRSEDMRARINVLSEITGEWDQCVRRWANMNEHHKTTKGSPDSREEYFLYQTLLGVWPPGLTADDSASIQAVGERVKNYMQKSMREAKLNSFWTKVNEEHEQAVYKFIANILGDKAWVSDFLKLQHVLSVCGMYSSLTQTVVKVMTPGVPDTYQGCEMWDYSMVDPDNRRPVDYDLRKKTLDTVLSAVGSESGAPLKMAAGAESKIAAMLKNMPDGAIKMFVTNRTLQLRKAEAELFQNGSYEPLEASGKHANRVVAFARRYKDRTVIVVATRFFADIVQGDLSRQPVGDVWGDTAVSVAKVANDKKTFQDVLSGQTHDLASGTVSLSKLLGTLPVAVLSSHIL
eukprot:TRINITY_DN1968_c0_g1_i2.p1 TRINITY_DN1968_c0_g1~~TRINITY_DN1968_c0_g1_i2.p1  ORF type:complete len:976 (+),score=266.51 TRINITY_DN1968_c0_g1_i2:85-3012(+)